MEGNRGFFWLVRLNPLQPRPTWPPIPAPLDQQHPKRLSPATLAGYQRQDGPQGRISRSFRLRGTERGRPFESGKRQNNVNDLARKVAFDLRC